MTGPISNKELLHFKDIFDLIDTDHDGSISSKELGNLFKQLGFHDVNPQTLAQMINMIDKDQNGIIDFPEFLTLIGRYRSDDPEKEIKEAFNAFDTNGDGFIDFGELKRMMEFMGEKLTDADVQLMITEADTDKDGTINYAEFKQMMEKMEN